MYKLILVRHGESIWNLENRFTGWTDVDLSEKGIEEARKAGQSLKKSGIRFQVSYTSVLRRAIATHFYLASEADLLWIPNTQSWRLNERHYGALQGLNKAETAEKYGNEQVKIWRRSFDTPPPLLDEKDARHPRFEEKYHQLDPAILPLSESLKQTIDRVLPFWEDTIVPSLKDEKTVLVTAHGNSLRALTKHLEKISDQDIVNLEIPTGTPQIYELDQDLNPLKHYYL
ncbi:MAG: 2,3-diphosphoglycerate-dependent phosphoglycerate mutase [Prevotellaceae bacterium]|jgi:2,3-bisphosphoglycerate-dependent phosphoglycerate mutase|nr:2,3-diphosphoglycerate-dependent phosphoglycerate mutase [Prevotellaceae bacterium]